MSHAALELPQGFLESIAPLLGDGLSAFADSFSMPAFRALRFSGRGPRPALEGLGKPVPWEPEACYLNPDVRLGAHPLHWAGAFYLQEPSAMAAARALSPRPGSRVLDLCAAPGGKTMQLAVMAGLDGLLVANEVVLARAAELSRNVERMGLRNTVVISEEPGRLSSRFPQYFDSILVDAPCSGEGMFRREPAVAGHWDISLPGRNAFRQLGILAAAADMLRPGGKMVYSTCTFNRMENEDVVAAFLASNPTFSLQPICLPGLPAADRGMLRIWPHLEEGEGHFIALLRKEGGNGENGITDSLRLNNKPDARRQAILTGVNLALAAWTRDDVSADALLGDCAVQAPRNCPDLSGLRVLRLGLHLGNLRGRTARPDHALALGAAPRQNMPLSLPEAETYRAGLELACDPALSGFATPTLSGWPLGWGKAGAGILKNHYPKGLRRLGSGQT